MHHRFDIRQQGHSQHSPRNQFPVGALLKIFPAIGYRRIASVACVLEMPPNATYVCKRAFRGRFRGFDFKQNQPIRLFYQEIDFGAMFVPIERETMHGTCACTLMDTVFQYFRNHPRFENFATQRMRENMFWLSDAKQPAKQACIVEIQLGHLDQALVQVGTEGRQAECDITRLQNAEPGFCGGLRNTAIPCQRRIFEQLPRTPGAQRHKLLKSSEVADITERSNIPLHIICDIGAEPVRRIKFFVEDARIASAEQGLFKG